MAWPQHFGSLVVFISLGLIAFRGIGMVIASVANTMQEGTILVQLLYFPMLFLSGATFPKEYFHSRWLLVISKFIPATYLVDGIKSIVLENKALTEVLPAIGAILLTVVMALILGMKLFRWEKDEKIRPAAKLWVLAALLPFFALGILEIIGNK
jgi:ABC-2 type transport system permease protein